MKWIQLQIDKKSDSIRLKIGRLPDRLPGNHSRRLWIITEDRQYGKSE